MTTVKIYPNVKMIDPLSVGEFTIIGLPVANLDDCVTKIAFGAKIRSHTVIYADNVIGKNFQTGHHVLIRESNKIGDNVSIGSSSVIEHHVTIGDNVRIHSQVFVPEFSILEEGCWLGPNVVLTNAKYPRSPEVKDNLVGPRIGKFAKIGANVTILPGVIIGENALVGAGSVVTKNVPTNAVVAGNPAVNINNLVDLPYKVKE